MAKLNKRAVQWFIEDRYPTSKIITIEMVDELETMAFVLVYENASVVERIVVDINSDGLMDVWSHEVADFTEIYRREEP